MDISNPIINGSYYRSNTATIDGRSVTYIGAIRENGYDDTPIAIYGNNDKESQLIADKVVVVLNGQD